jgi:hypothetical protein
LALVDFMASLLRASDRLGRVKTVR